MARSQVGYDKRTFIPLGLNLKLEGKCHIFEKVKPKTKDIKGLNSSKCITHKVTIL